MTTQGVTVESLGIAYTELSTAIAPAAYGKRPEDVVAALLLTAMVAARERVRMSGKEPAAHKEAVVDLVGKLYDMATTHLP